jgi:hypothetical protein
MSEPTCDNCGASLNTNSEFYSEEYQFQRLPPGETVNGRDYIVVCRYGLCLDPNTEGGEHE